MPQISHLIDLLTKSDSTPAMRLDASRCLRRRLAGFACSNCISVCPHGAISLEDHSVTVDPRRCRNCMLCTTVCPSDVFVPEDDNSRGFDFSEISDEIFISCVRQPHFYPEAADVPCLGKFSMEELIYLGTAGRDSIFRFNGSGCADCENYPAFKKFESSVLQLNAYAATYLNAVFIIDREEDDPEQDRSSSRRYFLTSLKQAVVKRSLQRGIRSREENDDRIKKREIFLRQRWVRQALACVSSQHRKSFLRLTTHAVKVLPHCDPCRRCSGICPTGALKITRGGDGNKVSFFSESCCGCGLCVSFCKKNALTLSRAALLDWQV